jgi:hypothetical protein
VFDLREADVASANTPELPCKIEFLCNASDTIRQGVHPRIVMEILGHSQISQTVNTYAQVLPRAQRQVAALMDPIFPAARAGHQAGAAGV